jgi:hypothetical protein
VKRVIVDGSYNRRTRAEPLSSKTWATLRPAATAAQDLHSGVGRFAVYDFLSAVYRTHRSWKRREIARRMARVLARQMNIPWRKDVSPIRVLIEATLPDADPKKKSRWVRALQYASMRGVSANDLREFFGNHRGIAGCARLAAKRQPKQIRARDDWAEEDEHAAAVHPAWP